MNHLATELLDAIWAILFSLKTWVLLILLVLLCKYSKTARQILGRRLQWIHTWGWALVIVISVLYFIRWQTGLGPRDLFQKDYQKVVRQDDLDQAGRTYESKSNNLREKYLKKQITPVQFAEEKVAAKAWLNFDTTMANNPESVICTFGRQFDEKTGVIKLELRPACMEGFEPWIYSEKSKIQKYQVELRTRGGSALKDPPTFTKGGGASPVTGFEVEAQDTLYYYHEKKFAGQHLVLWMIPK